MYEILKLKKKAFKNIAEVIVRNGKWQKQTKQNKNHNIVYLK